MKLVDEKTGAVINKGDKVKTFRGEDAIVTGWRAPLHSSSTGRVHIKIGGKMECEYFPSVIGAKIVED